ncbi:hypothetical protein BaRGS_00038874, partial [Batillaria attramentaria]
MPRPDLVPVSRGGSRVKQSQASRGPYIVCCRHFLPTPPASFVDVISAFTHPGWRADTVPSPERAPFSYKNGARRKKRKNNERWSEQRRRKRVSKGNETARLSFQSGRQLCVVTRAEPEVVSVWDDRFRCQTDLVGQTAGSLMSLRN